MPAHRPQETHAPGNKQNPQAHCHNSPEENGYTPLQATSPRRSRSRCVRRSPDPSCSASAPSPSHSSESAPRSAARNGGPRDKAPLAPERSYFGKASSVRRQPGRPPHWRAHAARLAALPLEHGHRRPADQTPPATRRPQHESQGSRQASRVASALRVDLTPLP